MLNIWSLLKNINNIKTEINLLHTEIVSYFYKFVSHLIGLYGGKRERTPHTRCKIRCNTELNLMPGAWDLFLNNPVKLKE